MSGWCFCNRSASRRSQRIPAKLLYRVDYADYATFCSRNDCAANMNKRPCEHDCEQAAIEIHSLGVDNRNLLRKKALELDGRVLAPIEFLRQLIATKHHL